MQYRHLFEIVELFFGPFDCKNHIPNQNPRILPQLLLLITILSEKIRSQVIFLANIL